MKKFNLGWMLALVFVMVLGMAACAQQEETEGTMEEMGEQTEQAMEEAGETMEEAAEETGEAMEEGAEEAGEAMEEMGEEGGTEEPVEETKEGAEGY